MHANITSVAFSIRWCDAACFFSMWLHSLMQRPCYFFPFQMKSIAVTRKSLHMNFAKWLEWNIFCNLIWTKCTVSPYSKKTTKNTSGSTRCPQPLLWLESAAQLRISLNIYATETFKVRLLSPLGAPDGAAQVAEGKGMWLCGAAPSCEHTSHSMNAKRSMHFLQIRPCPWRFYSK